MNRELSRGHMTATVTEFGSAGTSIFFCHPLCCSTTSFPLKLKAESQWGKWKQARPASLKFYERSTASVLCTFLNLQPLLQHCVLVLEGDEHYSKYLWQHSVFKKVFWGRVSPKSNHVKQSMYYVRVAKAAAQWVSNCTPTLNCLAADSHQ